MAATASSASPMESSSTKNAAKSSGTARFGNAPCQEAGQHEARPCSPRPRWQPGKRRDRLPRCRACWRTRAAHARDRATAPRQGRRRGPGQDRCGRPAQRQQLTLEPAPVHLGLGQAATRRGRGSGVVGATAGRGRFRIEDARRLKGRQLLQHVLLIRACPAGRSARA